MVAQPCVIHMPDHVLLLPIKKKILHVPPWKLFHSHFLKTFLVSLFLSSPPLPPGCSRTPHQISKLKQNFIFTPVLQNLGDWVSLQSIPHLPGLGGKKTNYLGYFHGISGFPHEQGERGIQAWPSLFN